MPVSVVFILPYAVHDAAHEIFNNFSADELGVEILKFSDAHFCSACQEFIFDN